VPRYYDESDDESEHEHEHEHEHEGLTEESAD
jgi:hypothetical protein